MVKMSRTMPPTPVAAPWNGSTALGWLWLSTLKTTASPWPMSTAPGILLTRADEDVLAVSGQQFQQRTRILVAAVLAPHGAEHAQLNAVGSAAKLDANALILAASERDFPQVGI